ncbi:transporter [Polaribacter sp.]|uniref:transporter n=1 Tax=Polaribacter sp. TaxID=1920175 RepID=UPI003EF583A0
MKNQPTKLFLSFFLFGFLQAFGQYTDVINSNKPGFSESPYSVGTGVYQFESSIFFKNTSIEPTFTIPQSAGFDLLFRTSFLFEKLELNTHLTYQKDKVAFKNIFTSHYNTSGLSNLTVAAKYLIFQQEFTDKSKEVRSWKRRMAFDKKRLIPSVALYVGLNTDFVNDIYKTQKMTPKFGLLLQNDLSDDLNIITNVYFDKMGTDFEEFSYIVTATQNFSDRWSAFFENQGVFLKYQNYTNIAAGLAYLQNKNLQINISGRMLFEGKSSGFYAGLGVSYRINKHKDSYIELDDSGQEILREKDYRGGFFKRLLSNFKKSDPREKLRKENKRSRKKTTTRRSKGGLFGLFSKKNKKPETDIEKLERELKELDKEIKKEEKAKEKKNRKADKKSKKAKKKKVETEEEKLEREIKELEEEIKREEKQEKKKKDNN